MFLVFIPKTVQTDYFVFAFQGMSCGPKFPENPSREEVRSKSPFWFWKNSGYWSFVTHRRKTDRCLKAPTVLKQSRQRDKRAKRL